jgi:hypothetical protein
LFVYTCSSVCLFLFDLIVVSWLACMLITWLYLA